MAHGDIKIKVDDFLTQTRVNMCAGKKEGRTIYACECKHHSIKDEGCNLKTINILDGKCEQFEKIEL